jgi:hypothetical protein
MVHVFIIGYEAGILASSKDYDYDDNNDDSRCYYTQKGLTEFWLWYV